jgi:hypothetical protein
MNKQKNIFLYYVFAVFIIFILLFTYKIFAQQDTVDATTLVGKYMCGYQGWFRCPNDGSGGGWFHWFNSQTPSYSSLNIDLFPDLTEYGQDELFATNMHYADGSVVKLFSSYKEATVLRHFKWMKDYNIDGVWVQRFGPKHVGWNDFTNKVLLNCKKGAETYGRVFVVMYDVSGANNSTLFNDLTSDWKYLVDTFKITQSPRYLKYKGKPLVSVWGFGFSDRSITPDVAQRIINWFKQDAEPKYQVTIMGGVNDDWRTKTDAWATVCRSVDIISPWLVGRFADIAGVDSWKTYRMMPDIEECKKIGKDYLPVIWPGFSWSNMHHGQTPQNQIPRRGGAFFWQQVYNSISCGSNMLYNAMFDEVDEGTAMFKACPKKSLAPVDGWTLTLDADGYNNLPSDWYLRLAGYAKKMLVGQIPLSKTMPLNPNKPDSGYVDVSYCDSKNINANMVYIDKNFINIQLKKNMPVEITIKDISGKSIKRLQLEKGTKSYRIPISLFEVSSNGIYFYCFNIGNNFDIITKIFIK